MAPPGENDLPISRMQTVERDTLLETNSEGQHLKMGCLEYYYFHFGAFRHSGAKAVSFREGSSGSSSIYIVVHGLEKHSKSITLWFSRCLEVPYFWFGCCQLPKTHIHATIWVNLKPQHTHGRGHFLQRGGYLQQ